jgi:hypothetical protein
MEDKSKSSILLKKMRIDAGQEKLLEELTETILPATSTPGAKDIYAHLFALRMLDDCYKEEDQKRFLKGMEQFEKMAKAQLDTSFVKASPAQRQTLLKNIEADKEAKDDVNYFYSTTKGLTIQAYTTSEYYLTRVHVYEMVPSRYHGCVPVKALSTKPA